MNRLIKINSFLLNSGNETHSRTIIIIIIIIIIIFSFINHINMPTNVQKEER